MASIAQFNQNGSLAVDCNTATLSIVEYVPALPNKLAGRYDLVTRITDSFRVVAKASTLDGVANALGTLERYLYNASLNPAAYLEFLWKADTLTNTGTANVYEGSLRREGRALKTDDGKFLQSAVVEIVRDPVWYGAWTSITFDASTPGTINNDDTCYVVLPTLPGDLPALCQFIVQSTGGNSANAQRALASLKSVGAANFSHILQVESADYLDASLTSQSSTNFSPGGGGVTAKRYTPPDTSFRLLARWNKTANLASWQSTFLALSRYKENATVKNFQLRFRAGDIVSGNYVVSPWATADKVRLPNTTYGTTEIGLLALGTVRTPRQAGRQVPVGGVFFELWGEGLSVAGTLDLDNLFLFPIGECGPGLGALAAEFDLAFNVGRAAFDSRPGYGLAYLHDGTNYMSGAASHPQGGALYLPPQVATQRVYFLVMQNEAGFFRHDRTNTLGVTGFYKSRWVSMPGTN